MHIGPKIKGLRTRMNGKSIPHWTCEILANRIFDSVESVKGGIAN